MPEALILMQRHSRDSINRLTKLVENEEAQGKLSPDEASDLKKLVESIAPKGGWAKVWLFVRLYGPLILALIKIGMAFF